jgi:ATP-dependent helicase/DNAse subunit B
MARDFKYNKVKNDKYSAVWLSHSSVSDYKKCPRLYFLRNVWKNENGRKVNTVSPAMSLGSAVHSVLEPLANVKTDSRFERDLLEIYDENWSKFAGRKGGFLNDDEEAEYKAKGKKMLENVIANKGPLAKKTVKFYDGDFIPNTYLSEDENIILCGLVDWVEYMEETDSLRVIDFKTGKNSESDESYQLLIYKVLVEALQKRKVTRAAYWYLDREKILTDKELIDEDIDEMKKGLLSIGIEIKNKKESSRSKEEIEEAFKCVKSGTGEVCYACRDMELVRNYTFDTDEIEYLGVGEYKQDLYLIKK